MLNGDLKLSEDLHESHDSAKLRLVYVNIKWVTNVID